MLLTVVETVLLWIGDMTFFEALNHSLTTMSTGGFSTNAGSMGAFSAYAQWIVIIFMVLAGASFSLHYRAGHDPRVYLRGAEFPPLLVHDGRRFHAHRDRHLGRGGRRGHP